MIQLIFCIRAWTRTSSAFSPSPCHNTPAIPCQHQSERIFQWSSFDSSCWPWRVWVFPQWISQGNLATQSCTHLAVRSSLFPWLVSQFRWSQWFPFAFVLRWPIKCETIYSYLRGRLLLLLADTVAQLSLLESQMKFHTVFLCRCLSFLLQPACLYYFPCHSGLFEEGSSSCDLEYTLESAAGPAFSGLIDRPCWSLRCFQSGTPLRWSLSRIL